MKSNNFWIWVIIGLVLIGGFFLIASNSPKANGDESGEGWYLRLYDINGNEIKIPSTFSGFSIWTTETPISCSSDSDCPARSSCWRNECVIRNVGSMSLDFSVTSQSSDVTYNNLHISSATPIEWYNELPSDSRTLAPGAKTVFTSNVFPIPSSWEDGSRTFSVTVQGTSDYDGSIVSDSKSITYKFYKDPTGGFTININNPFNTLLATHSWDFDEGDGTTAMDSIGNNMGFISGATYTTGKSGNALQFDGVDDYVNCGNIEIGNEFTISLWVNPQPSQEICYDGSRGNYGVAGNIDSAEGTSTWDWELRYGAPNSCSLGFQINTLSGSKWVEVGHDLTPNEWTHIVATYSGTEERIYVNNILEDTNTFSKTSINANPNNRLLFGVAGWGEANTYFNGKIDEVKIFNRVLSPKEIETLYNG